MVRSLLLHRRRARYLVDGAAMTERELTEAEREKIMLDDTRDGMLFRFWIRAGSYPGGYPGETMVAIAHCHTPEEYRLALTLLARRKGVNLP